MVHLQSLVNHSNGRVLFRRHKKLLRRSSKKKNCVPTFEPEPQPLSLLDLDFSSDLLFVCNDVCSFLMKSWPHFFIIIASIFMSVMVSCMERIVTSFEYICSIFTGQAFVLCSLLLLRGTVVDMLMVGILISCVPNPWRILVNVAAFYHKTFASLLKFSLLSTQVCW